MNDWILEPIVAEMCDYRLCFIAISDADFVVIAAPTNVYAKFSVPKIRPQNDLKTHTPEGDRKNDKCRIT